MRKALLIALLLLPSFAHANTIGQQGITAVKQCIMQNDIEFCHKIMTAESYGIFDRFFSYKLMPCLPTDFTYENEQEAAKKTIVKASLPADNRSHYEFRLVFVGQPPNVKIDIPETFHIGLGDNWQNKVNFMEQLYLMMKQNMKDKLTCDMLRSLVIPPHKNG